MFQSARFFVVFSVLLVSLSVTASLNAQVVYSSGAYSYSPSTVQYSTPTVQYSTPIYNSTPTYYSTPTYSSAPSYYAPSSNQAYYNNRNVRFRDPYTQYNNWYTVSPPTYRECLNAGRYDGPNEQYARAFNNANGVSYRHGLRSGFNRLSVSSARERDDILRARAFTESRGLTWNNGLIRGYLGAAIRSSARD